MQINSNDICFICGSFTQLDKMPRLKRLPPFSDIVCDFLSDMSAVLMKHPGAKSYPDVMTFGFFCRRGNISRLRSQYSNGCINRLGKGVSFHIAPSNVPINFAYSLAAALLAGNSCIVRASSKMFEQIDIVCECISQVLSNDRFSELVNYIAVIRYSKNKEINDYLSSVSNIRIIWGGDNTVSEIRQSPLPPRTTEITFADRYSIAVIDSNAINNCENMVRLANDFYNDTYLYDQNACSSPRLIYWLGSIDETNKARKKFWNAVHEFISGKYLSEQIVAVNKYTAACRMAIDHGAKIEPQKDNLISRMEVKALTNDLPDYRCAGGSFIEFCSDDLNAIKEIVNEKYQTLSYYGIDKQALVDFVISNGLRGIDRIVPIGKTADFSLVWDGYDLIIQMSRAVSC